MGAAGKIRTPQEAEAILDRDVDWIMLGRAAILHHDFPNRYDADQNFEPVDLPVSSGHLRNEGLSERFVTYMNTWKGFVDDDRTVRE